MQSAPSSHAAHAPAPPPGRRATRGDLGTSIEACLDQTAEALVVARAASPADVSHAMDAVREAQAEGRPARPVRSRRPDPGPSGGTSGPASCDLGDRLAAILNPSPPLIPFAGKLIAPSAFYESFDQIHKIARVLLSPVIYAEDTDAIGTASANPVAAMILAEEIRNTVFKRFGIRPFVTAARLDYESWTFLSRKHFEL